MAITIQGKSIPRIMETDRYKSVSQVSKMNSRIVLLVLLNCLAIDLNTLWTSTVEKHSALVTRLFPSLSTSYEHVAQDTCRAQLGMEPGAQQLPRIFNL